MLMDVGCQMQCYKFDSIWQITLHHQDFKIIIVQRNLYTRNRDHADLEFTRKLNLFLINFIYPK